MTRSLLRPICWLAHHRDVTVRRRRDGILITATICDRCRRVDLGSITTRRWNRAARRAAAREVARRIVG